MKPLKFFCSECNEKLTIKFIENDKDEERIWLEPCQQCGLQPKEIEQANED